MRIEAAQACQAPADTSRRVKRGAAAAAMAAVVNKMPMDQQAEMFVRHPKL
ncbi:hypothetical protein [Nonomuraea sp. NPDC049709]|uniref:hypothetical protein n=1 Tax=Nonomuraea sp. NPDC049709 TaxID=3154736 RepID=UPI00343882CF